MVCTWLKNLIRSMISLSEKYISVNMKETHWIGYGQFIRKGIVSDWKNYFNSENMGNGSKGVSQGLKVFISFDVP